MLCPTQCSHFHISLLPTCMCYVTRGIQTHFSPFPYSTFVLYLEYTSLSTFTFLEEIFQLYPHSKLNYFESSNKYHNIIHNTASIEHVLCSETVVVVLYMLFLILMKTDKVGIIIVRDKQGGASWNLSGKPVLIPILLRTIPSLPSRALWWRGGISQRLPPGSDPPWPPVWGHPRNVTVRGEKSYLILHIPAALSSSSAFLIIYCFVF